MSAPAKRNPHQAQRGRKGQGKAKAQGRAKPLELWGEPFYLLFSVALDSQEEAERFFNMASTEHASHLAEAVRKTLATLFRLPRDARLVIPGQMYPLGQVLDSLVDEDEDWDEIDIDSDFGINVSFYAETIIDNIRKHMKLAPIPLKDMKAVGIGTDQPGARMGGGLACEPPQADYPARLRCVLPVVIVGNKRSFAAWVDNLIADNEFWRVPDNGLTEAAGKAFGCQGQIKPLGLVADVMLDEEVADILDLAALVAETEEDDGIQFLPDVLPLPVFCGNGVVAIPFLTFDAFAQAHTAFAAQELGEAYSVYLFIYRQVCEKLIEAQIPFRVIRGSRGLIFGDEDEQQEALYSALNEHAIEDTLIERSTHESRAAQEEPSCLTACLVMPNDVAGEAHDPDELESDRPPVCIVVSASGEQGIIWQENIYLVAPSDGETALAYIEKIEAQYGIRMLWDKTEAIPYCENCRKVMGQNVHGLVEPEPAPRMMRH